MKKYPSRRKHNDRVQAMQILDEADPAIVERVRERIAIEFGTLMGVRFKLREQFGCEPHPKDVRAEMARLLGGIWKVL